MSRSHRLLLAVILLAALLLIGALALAALPAVVRALPGRYAYYLPEPLQAWRHVEHPDTLPTPLPTATVPPTATETPHPTDQPTPTPTLTPSPTPSPTPEPALPARVTLSGLSHEHQGWNNCGPTTLAMALSYWGRSETQYDLAPLLKPDPEDKNVSPEEMAVVVRDLGLQAIVRVGGDLDRLKRLLANGFPVVVETWYVRDARDQLGHYRLLVGYDDAAQQFITYDSLHGPDLPIGYQELDDLWRVFNRVYLIPYPIEREAELAELLGADFDAAMAASRALDTARAEAMNPPTTCVAYADCQDAETFAWFNVGSSLLAMGQPEAAATAYDQSRTLGLHWRMLWYQFGPYEAYYAAGRYDDVITLADATLATTANLEESYYWRGMARLAQGDTAGARSDWETALNYHPGWPPALQALESVRQ